MAKIKLNEGDVFFLPIGDFFCLGIITRLRNGKIPFGYFYKQLYTELPKIENLNFDKNNIVYISQFGVQGFKDGSWKIIGKLPGFNIKDWPLPIFYQKNDSLPDQLVYLDDNLEEIKRERALLSENEYENLPRAGLGGSGYIEKKLAKILLFNH